MSNVNVVEGRQLHLKAVHECTKIFFNNSCQIMLPGNVAFGYVWVYKVPELCFRRWNCYLWDVSWGLVLHCFSHFISLVWHKVRKFLNLICNCFLFVCFAEVTDKLADCRSEQLRSGVKISPRTNQHPSPINIVESLIMMMILYIIYSWDITMSHIKVQKVLIVYCFVLQNWSHRIIW